MIPLVSRPKARSLIVGQSLVVCISCCGHGKGRVTGVENEQDHSYREQVYLHALILLVLMYLGSHVAHSSHDCLQRTTPVPASNSSCKAHVDDLQIVVLIEQDIRRLQVSMAEPFLVHVYNPLQELFHVEADDGSSESACISHISI